MLNRQANQPSMLGFGIFRAKTQPVGHILLCCFQSVQNKHTTKTEYAAISGFRGSCPALGPGGPAAEERGGGPGLNPEPPVLLLVIAALNQPLRCATCVSECLPHSSTRHPAR